MPPAVAISRPDPAVALVTIDRPERRNALTWPMFDELREAVQAAAADARAVVITGAGEGFCAGGDLDAIDQLVRAGDEAVLVTQEQAAELVAALRTVSVPVISAVNGAAVGAGLAIAAASDLRIAEPGSRFCAGFIRVGFTGGDMGVSWLLPRLIGLGPATEMLLTGAVYDAAWAERVGLVNRVVPADELLATAVGLGRAIAAHPPLSVRLTKEVVQLNVDATSLHAAQQVENRNQVLVCGTPDMGEALAAFRERRPAVYGGDRS